MELKFVNGIKKIGVPEIQQQIFWLVTSVGLGVLITSARSATFGLFATG